MGKVLAVCISEKKGTQKKNVGSAVFVEDWGLEGDAHAGKWHRQVSLLSGEKIDAFRAKGAEVEDGAFGENLVVEGIDFAKLPVGTRFRCGEVVLELTQIGKECHNGCAIFQKMGECIMPREGVFTRVLKGGKVSVGDEMTVDKAMIFDTHAHYDDEAFDEDRFAMLDSMQESGIGHIVDVCASVGHFDRVYDLVEKYPFVYGAVESVSLRGDSGTYAAGHDSRGHPGLCRPGCGVSAAYGDQSICESGPAGQGRPAGGPPGAGSFGCGIAPHSPGWAGLCAAGSGGRLWTGGLVWVPATGRHVRGHFRLCPYPGRAGRCGGFDFDEVTV